VFSNPSFDGSSFICMSIRSDDRIDHSLESDGAVKRGDVHVAVIIEEEC